MKQELINYGVVEVEINDNYYVFVELGSMDSVSIELVNREENYNNGASLNINDLLGIYELKQLSIYSDKGFKRYVINALFNEYYFKEIHK